MRNILDRLTFILTHHILLIFAITGSFLSFSLHPGSIGDFMKGCGILFLINLITGHYRFSDFNKGHIIFFAVFLLVLGINFTVPLEMVHKRSFQNFLYVPGMVMAVDCLALKLEKHGTGFFSVFCASVLLVVLAAQLIVHLFFENKGDYGMYGNLHHMGLFSSVTLPVVAYFFAMFKGWPRIILVIAGLSDFYLLWESSSRISWLGFFFGVMLTGVLFFTIKNFGKAIAVLLIAGYSTAYISGFSPLENRVHDLLSNWRQEERFVLTSDALNMLNDSSVKEWITGHGIGSYRFYNQKYTTKNMTFGFPHNVFLQILFENGIIGFIAIFGGFSLLLFALWRTYHKLKEKPDIYFLVTIFSVFWISFIHCALTKSIYSKYIIYPLSLIIGISFALIRKGNNRAEIEG